MPLTLNPIPLPLRTDGSGVVRVGGTRVPLDTVVDCFKRGHSPQQIADAFPVRLADVYAVISFYLSHAGEVEAYLREREAFAEEVRRGSPLPSPRNVRERLSGRRGPDPQP